MNLWAFDCRRTVNNMEVFFFWLGEWLVDVIVIGDILTKEWLSGAGGREEGWPMGMV